jgi:hypothetical protein
MGGDSYSEGAGGHNRANVKIKNQRLKWQFPNYHPFAKPQGRLRTERRISYYNVKGSLAAPR